MFAAPSPLRRRTHRQTKYLEPFRLSPEAPLVETVRILVRRKPSDSDYKARPRQRFHPSLCRTWMKTPAMVGAALISKKTCPVLRDSLTPLRLETFFGDKFTCS